MEQWSTIAEAPRYKISSLGNVYSTISNTQKKSFPDKKGYMRVQLYRYKGKAITRKVHRLVAQHFIPNPLRYKQVNHINLNKQDNRVDNLEWCSQQQNMRHAVESGACNKRKDIIALLPQIRTATREGYILSDIARNYSFSASWLSKKCKAGSEYAPITTLKTGRRRHHVYYDSSRSKWRTELRNFGLKNRQFSNRADAEAYVATQLHALGSDE